MRRRTLMLGGMVAANLSCTSRAAEPPVVLELFTSQGCSSCPPADALLGELSRQPDIIGLAWHVDYWDSLGWRDPYARRQWTDRQRSYASRLHDEVYTPALVVNGATMVVGSDRQAIAAAIRRVPLLSVPLELRRTGQGLSATCGPMPEPMTALLVVYDPQRATDVAAGENGGRSLREYRIVREAYMLAPRAIGNGLPEVSRAQGAVLMLQDAAWRVRGAADLRPDQSS